MSSVADDYMVKQGDSQHFASFYQCFCQLAVVNAGAGVAGGVVVCYKYAGGVCRDGLCEDFSRVYSSDLAYLSKLVNDDYLN